jgi:hypothetical protein
MAAPFPPAGEQKQYTERPVKIYGEQFLAGAPLPIGVRTTAPTGDTTPPYVINAAGQYKPVHDTDWIVSSRYSGVVLDVLSNEEFIERYGGGGAETVG